MIRPVLTEVAIFLTPFALYAVYLFARRAKVFEKDSWPAKVLAKLTLVALLLTIASLVLLAHFSGAPPTATYAPAHIENGKLVRGVNK
ncbi:MAG TPA: DUF6111 family protein [Xanthobacteraceae bacterium]|nr:DUF6111 family protein [Xanthobacteraceae bacterium]